MLRKSHCGLDSLVIDNVVLSFNMFNSQAEDTALSDIL